MKRKKTILVNSKLMHFEQLLNESCSEINIHLKKLHETKQYCKIILQKAELTEC
jgi:hypothetical protein